MKNWKDADEIIEFLKKNKFNIAGDGSYASVWEPPGKSDFVVKVVPSGDLCWESYLMWVNDHKGSPHVPKIKSFRKHIKEEENKIFIVSVIEKLDPIYGNKFGFGRSQQYKHFGIKTYEHFIDYCFHSFVENKESLWSAGTLLHAAKSEYGKSQNWDQYLSKYYPDESWSTDDKLAKKGQALIRRKFFRSPLGKLLGELHFNPTFNKKCFMDLHAGNFMIRPSTNEIVVTDPLAER